MSIDSGNALLVLVTINLAFALFYRLKGVLVYRHKKLQERVRIELCNIIAGLTGSGLYIVYLKVCGESPIGCDIARVINRLNSFLRSTLEFTVSFCALWSIVNLIMYSGFIIYSIDHKITCHSSFLYQGLGPWFLVFLLIVLYRIFLKSIAVFPFIYFVWVDWKVIRKLRKMDISLHIGL